MKYFEIKHAGFIVVRNKVFHKCLKIVIGLFYYSIYRINNSKVNILVKRLEILQTLIFALEALISLDNLVNHVLLQIDKQLKHDTKCNYEYNHYKKNDDVIRSNATKKPSE